MSTGVIIVAGGRGLRFGAPVPKQVLPLGGRPLIRWSIEAFDRHPVVDELVVVLPEDLLARGTELAGPVSSRCTFVAGGAERHESVRCGLQALGPDVTLVLIHDAARPFVTDGVIDRVIEAARETGAAVPAVPARDTVKRATPTANGPGDVVATVPREEIWLAQTPQGFERHLVTRAADRVAAEAVTVTDDAMAVERLGHAVRIVAGDEANMKITTEADLAGARARVDPAPRVGTGYDLHRLVEGRPLVLAGVVVDPTRGPDGHSDGDVACHALVDAVLGAAAAGDIGRHFPNSDPRWKDAAGLDLLSRALAIAGEMGWRLVSGDVSVVLERPKLGPHAEAIRRAIATAAGISPEAVGFKAKTNEGVDAVGRGEAVAAHAVAVLVRTGPA